MPTADLVLAFPGQGSLSPGVGAPWRDHPCFAVVGEVGASTNTDLGRLLVDGDADALVATRNAQLATYALSLAILDASGLAPRATYALGHSLGEYTALVATSIVDRDGGARLVEARGTAMLEAASQAPGTMVAMIGGDEAVAAAACESIGDLWVANLNGPGQVVLGGTVRAVEEATSRAKELGFRRAIPLRVGGAFHTPLMASAAPALAEALGATQFSAGTARVVANVDSNIVEQPQQWPALLTRQLTEPVDWVGCVRALPAGAVVVELGAGGVLTGLTRRIRDDLDCRSVGVPEDLAALEGLT